MKIQIILVALFLIVSGNAFSGWNVVTTKDSMTDDLQKSAVVKNQDGFSFSVYRLKSGEVWANFALPDRSFEQLAPDHPPSFRVDKNKANHLEDFKKIQEIGPSSKLLVWSPKWINFRVWHGKEEEGRGQIIKELMTGKSIVFRYVMFTGGSKETSFVLDGASQAIANALGISTKENSENSARAARYNAVMFAETDKCLKDLSTAQACLARYQKCSATSNKEPEKLQECLK